VGRGQPEERYCTRFADSGAAIRLHEVSPHHLVAHAHSAELACRHTANDSSARGRVAVWQRARAALCPKADPACKDPSRAYWLPSHSGGVSAKAACKDGPLVNASSLPGPPERERPELLRRPSAKVLRQHLC
jgi:hypothetical protein